ncbi:MAG: hypothetical protein PGN13_07150 [Patulibacter minatonensis]
MLNPSIQDTRDKLTAAYGGVLAVDAFARSVQSVQIVPIENIPSWLPPVENEFDQLTKAADAWQLDRADIWAPVITGFEKFAATFAAVAAPQQSANYTPADWISVLSETLLPAAAEAKAAVQASDVALGDRQSAFSNVLPSMDASIAAGWAALGSEEAAAQLLSQQLGSLGQQVIALGDTLTSDAIATDKGIAQSAVSMLYAAGSAGLEASVPILGLTVAVITIGKSFYDMVSDDTKLAQTMQQIQATQKQLSDEALAIAMTKSVLQTLYAVEEQYLALRDGLPGLVDTWTLQQQSISSVIDALRAGADPKLVFDLVTLPQAATSWQDIDTFVDQVKAADISAGEPVTVDVQAGTVRPTLQTR